MYGRYDVIVILKDIIESEIIIEFKRARKTNKKSIEEARKQIEDKKYEKEL